MTIILFIIVLLVTVLIHELGHFIAARKSSMTVEEFGFGIPPRLWSWKKGETTYSINALPFGGFVRIAGENGEDKTIPFDKQFESKAWWKQSIVLIAGVLCNILLAILLFTISYSLGTPTVSPTGTSTVVHVTTGSPIDQSGIKVGDVIAEVSKNNQKITDVDTTILKSFINGSTDPISIVYTHNKEQRNVIVSPSNENGTVALGIGVEKVTLESVSLPKAFIRAVNQSYFIAVSIFKTVANLLGNLIAGHKQTEQLIGPVGLAKEVRNASAIGFAYLLSFTAMISINLAVINILPFPALDGGRLIIVLLEKATGRKFSKKVVNIIHASGFILLITLMIVLSVGDVRRMF